MIAYLYIDHEIGHHAKVVAGLAVNSVPDSDKGEVLAPFGNSTTRTFYGGFKDVMSQTKSVLDTYTNINSGSIAYVVIDATAGDTVEIAEFLSEAGYRCRRITLV